MEAKVVAIGVISCFLVCVSLPEVASVERAGMFTAVRDLSELQEIHSAEKYSYLFLFPDSGPHSVLYPSFVSILLEGTNLVAAEALQVSEASSDLSFDLAMHSWRD